MFGNNKQQQQQQQQQQYINDQMAGSTNFSAINLHDTYAQQEESKIIKSKPKCRECAGTVYGRLYEGTLIQEPGVITTFEPGRRINKNVILCLTNARLLKEIYLSRITFSHTYQLLSGLPLNINNNNEFILAIRTDGRIIAMSDQAAHHFGKSMRSMYTQFIDVYQCLNAADSNKLGSILNSSFDLPNQEHSLICTFRLPKGKRPSRANEDVKTVYMSGHFFTCENTFGQSERLFIARCEALITLKTKDARTSQSTAINTDANSKSIMTITLKQDLSISTVSTNVNEILNYKSNEMIGKWFGRYLATDDIEKFQTIQEQFFQHEQQQQQKKEQRQEKKALPLSVCEVFDMYGNNGDRRLTFLCQIRIKRQRRLKPIEFVVVAQLVDSSLREEYVKYVESESKTKSASTEVEQVNLDFPSAPQTSKDSSIATSPSLDMGLLRLDNIPGNDLPHQNLQSPFNRELSNVVTPLDFDDEFWEQFCNNDCNQYPTTTYSQYGSTNCNYNAITACQTELDLTGEFNDIDEWFGMNGFH